MKQGYFFRVIGMWMLISALPVIGRADEKRFSHDAAVLADSVLVPQQDDKSKKKDKEQPKKDEGTDKAKNAPEDTKAEPDVKRPAVKEVPKARPKLRPAVVTDKIKIKKPPIKVKGLIRSVGI